MSERGTYVTSYLYDPALGPVLKKHLEGVTREGTMLVREPEVVLSIDRHIHFIAGLMHGGYPGEERSQMRDCVEGLLLDLPANHGQFSIIVMPEHETAAAMFVVSAREFRETKALEGFRS